MTAQDAAAFRAFFRAFKAYQAAKYDASGGGPTTAKTVEDSREAVRRAFAKALAVESILEAENG